MKTLGDWQVYSGNDKQSDVEDVQRWLSNPPPWRDLSENMPINAPPAPPMSSRSERRGRSYRSDNPEELQRINYALLLRRPLLVRGRPGVGKSTLAYNIAWCLGLGEPLRWEINSSSTLQDGLYTYDAVAHLNAAQLEKKGAVDIGEFITLGPFGNALLPSMLPRCLLIDELDKAPHELPHDLLHVFEEGRFVVRELARLEESSEVMSDVGRVSLPGGVVAAGYHPVVIITSNGERELPEAFLRRCVTLDLETPEGEQLVEIIRSMFKGRVSEEELARFGSQLEGQATDAVLQALYLSSQHKVDPSSAARAVKRQSEGS